MGHACLHLKSLQRGGVCWISLSPPPQPYWVFSKEWVWPGTLYFNELCSRLRIIAIASCSASWTHRGCFPALKYHFVSMCCPYGGLPLDFLSSVLPLKSINYLSLPVSVMVGNSIEFASLTTQNLLMLHQKTYQNSKPQPCSHAAQAGFQPTKRLKSTTVPCRASCFLPAVLQMIACRRADPRARSRELVKKQWSPEFVLTPILEV